MPAAPTDPSGAAAWLARNTVDCLPEAELPARLAESRPLRAKLGIDPTAPDIHLGFTVVLQKLREFQELGHQVVLILGDYTARVGDPSGRTATRPVLSGEEIDANAATFAQQAGKVLDMERVELRRNSEWLDMSMEELFALARIPTVAQLLERDDFAQRYAAGAPISLLELLYPVFQAYDSVAVRADLELGGTDQKFNLLLGRDIQRAYGQREQLVMTLPILPGIDGVAKMSKSLGNYIGVSEPPEDIYGKTLRLPDAALDTWYELLLGEPQPAELGPRDSKRALARALVSRFHGAAQARAAEQGFDRVFIEHDLPEEVAEVEFAAGDTVHVPALLAVAFEVSTSEARRLLAQSAVKVDGSTLGELDAPADQLDGRVLQVGRRRFARVCILPEAPHTEAGT